MVTKSKKLIFLNFPNRNKALQLSQEKIHTFLINEPGGIQHYYAHLHLKKFIIQYYRRATAKARLPVDFGWILRRNAWNPTIVSGEKPHLSLNWTWWHPASELTSLFSSISQFCNLSRRHKVRTQSDARCGRIRINYRPLLLILRVTIALSLHMALWWKPGWRPKPFFCSSLHYQSKN